MTRLRNLLLASCLGLAAGAAVAHPAAGAVARSPGATPAGLVGAWHLYSQSLLLDTGGTASGPVIPVSPLWLGANGRWRYGGEGGSWSVEPISASDWSTWRLPPGGEQYQLVLTGLGGFSASGPIVGSLGDPDSLWVIRHLSIPAAVAGTLQLRFEGHTGGAAATQLGAEQTLAALCPAPSLLASWNLVGPGSSVQVFWRGSEVIVVCRYGPPGDPTQSATVRLVGNPAPGAATIPPGAEAVTQLSGLGTSAIGYAYAGREWVVVQEGSFDLVVDADCGLTVLSELVAQVLARIPSSFPPPPPAG